MVHARLGRPLPLHILPTLHRPDAKLASDLHAAIQRRHGATTLPLSIRSIIANWNSPAGPQSANLTPVAGNRFQLVITANGPASGELQVTITATAADGAGNVGAGTLTVSLRNPASFGCA